MVTIGMNYNVVPGKEDAFVKMFEKVLDVMHGTEGHRKSWLYHDVHNPQNFLILSEWKQRKAFDDFVTSTLFRKVTEWGRDILAGRPVHQIFGEDDPQSSTSIARD